MATIKDIARDTGLSVATVSKFLNGGNVLEENKILLEEAVKKLDYRMNHIARGLKTRRSFTAGVLIPRLNNIFYSSLVAYIEEALAAYGFSTIICTYHDSPETEAAKLDFLLGKAVDGIIFIPLGARSQCASIINRSNVPMVMVDRFFDNVNCDVVLSDNFGSAYNAVEYLAGKGHSRIGVVLGPEGVYTADERCRGYLRAVRDLGLDSSPELIRRGRYDIESGDECLRAFLAMTPRPSALFITNYEMCIGGIIALERENIRIPEDMSIIGFDNLELAQAIRPPLTIVAQRLEDIAAESVRLLIGRINTKGTVPSTFKRFSTDLIVRESVADIK